MGLFDAVNNGLGKASVGTRWLVDRLALSAYRARAGTVLDSTRGEIVWAYDPAEHLLTISGGGLPAVTVPTAGALDTATAELGSARATLTRGKNLWRRATFTAHASLGGVEYALRPRTGRQSQFRRGSDVLAVLRRPRWRRPSIEWTGAATTQEAAVCHALAFYVGIGAPGFLSNSSGLL